MYNDSHSSSQIDDMFAREQKILEEALGPQHPMFADALLTQSLNRVSSDWRDNLARSGRALGIAEIAFGSDHPETVEYLRAHSQTLWRVGRVAEARAMTLRGFEILEKSLGVEDPRILPMMAAVATNLLIAGEVEHAKEMVERNFRLVDRESGAESGAVADALYFLAIIQVERGAWREAQDKLRRAAEIVGKIYSSGHPNTTGILDRLVSVHLRSGQLGVALRLAKENLELHASRGLENVHYSSGLMVLAEVQTAVGMYEQAHSECVRAREIEEAVDQSEPGMLLEAKRCEARVLVAQGRHREALQLSEERLAARLGAFGPVSPLVTPVLLEVAAIHLFLGSYEEARSHCERALANLEGQFRAETLPMVGALECLASVHAATGAATEERALRERVLAIRERALGPDALDVAFSRERLAHVLANLAELGAARALFEQALAAHDRTLGPNSLHGATSLVGLARLDLANPGGERRALALLERAVQRYDEFAGPQGDELMARFLLAKALLATGGSRERALAQARLARDGLRIAGSPAVGKLAAVEAWLADHGRGR